MTSSPFHPDLRLGRVRPGTLDLFHDEDLAYAQRLNDSGVPCEVLVVPGAFHDFDALFRTKPVSRDFWVPPPHRRRCRCRRG